MRRVFSTHDLLAAHHARNLLVASGIRAEVRNERLASAMGELPPAECQAEVWVADEGDVARAERLLREGVATDGTDLWVVDASIRGVLRYEGTAVRTGGVAVPASGFALHPENVSPSDLTTDGTTIWVTDDIRKMRAYPEQPPVIPHSIEGYQLSVNTNRCLSCHKREFTEGSGAPMISVTTT